MAEIADLKDKSHNACFADIADAFNAAMPALGTRRLVFGANDDKPRDFAPGTIVYNAEQLTGKEVTSLVPRADYIWDYSRVNIPLLTAAGYNAVHCPIGYHHSMTHIKPAHSEDIDVLFYGWINERRQRIMSQLKNAGLTTKWLVGKYGAERDQWIARAKVVLNVHFYEDGIFEIFRVSHLLANKKCVVTEAGGADPELNALAESTCAYVPYDGIVDACQRLVSSPRLRAATAECGFERFSRTSLVENIHEALRQSPVKIASNAV